MMTNVLNTRAGAPRFLALAALPVLAAALGACAASPGTASPASAEASATERTSATTAPSAGAGEGKGASTSAAALTVEAPASRAEVASHLPGEVEFIATDGGSQLSYYRLHDGMHMGTATETFARPALSLIKLYLATYVIEEGTVVDKYEALEMITNSSDESASELFDKYPESIDAIAEEYGLASTRAADTWGYSVTSTYDVMSFIVQLLRADPTHPVLVAMAQSEEVAADGYEQDYGTARLSNVIGTKWGWSDNHSLHSSVSFGENFVVAASVTGSADDLTAFVKRQVSVDNLNAATANHLEQKDKGAAVAPQPFDAARLRELHAPRPQLGGR